MKLKKQIFFFNKDEIYLLNSFIKLAIFFYEIHIQIYNKITPLHCAVEKEFIDIIKLLLTNKNIDINIKDGVRIIKYIKFKILQLMIFPLSAFEKGQLT